MIPSLTFLHESLTVETTEDGLVSVTVILPPDLVRDYCRFLDSLATFFGAVHRKSSISASLVRAASLAADPVARKNLQEYRELIVSAFDAYTCRGLDRKEAIKRVSADLRAESHPWCSADLVRSQLIAAGRGGRSGRPSSRRGQK